MVHTSPVASDPIIRLEDVHKTYGTGNARAEVLRGVSLEVKKGDFVALLGQSGSGKSTLLNIIGGLDEADSGEIFVLGEDFAKTSERDLARLRNEDIGFVFQSFNLLDHLDCLGNVVLPASFSREQSNTTQRGLEALGRVGLEELAHRKPAELSGGQKQRVAIARALFNGPTLLLCDEPTGNLDSETGHDVIEFFKQLNKEDGVTLVVVTHEERISDEARRVIRIEDGAILEHEGGKQDRVRDRESAS